MEQNHLTSLRLLTFKLSCKGEVSSYLSHLIAEPSENQSIKKLNTF